MGDEDKSYDELETKEYEEMEMAWAKYLTTLWLWRGTLCSDLRCSF